VDDGGGTELIASQDEPHGEEPAIAHAPEERRRRSKPRNGRRRRSTRSTRRTSRCPQLDTGDFVGRVH